MRNLGQDRGVAGGRPPASSTEPVVAERLSTRQFLELLEDVKDALYRHALRTAWRKDHAADIVQETVMIAWRELHRFEAGTNFKAWIFRILINTTYRFNKRHGRRQERALEETDLDLEQQLEREDTWARLRENPTLLRDLLDERLAVALDDLRDEERRCLLLRLVDGFSYREIAEMLEMPLGTVMSHVHRARMNLRERLASLASEYGLVEEPAS